MQNTEASWAYQQQKTVKTDMKLFSSKGLIKAAHIYCLLFSPFYAPLWAFIWLFLYSYLRLLPLAYKIFILVTVLMFTIVIPRVTINIFRKINKWTHWQLSHREHRYTPYLITIASYVACVILFTKINTAQFMLGILVATLVAGVLCGILNIWWKVSTHTAAMGGLTGTVVAFSYIFYFNPIPMMCIMLLLSGLMGTSRMILRQHSLSQVIGGFFIGFISALVFIMIGW